MQAENVFYLYLCIWIAYAECQWLDGLSSPSEFISSIKLSNYVFMSWEEDMYACVWKDAQQCHLALERRGETVFNIFLCVCVSCYDPWATDVKWALFCVLIQSLAQFSYVTPASCFVKYGICNSESLHYSFWMIRAIQIMFFPYKTGKHNTIVKILVKFQHGI